MTYVLIGMLCVYGVCVLILLVKVVHWLWLTFDIWLLDQSAKWERSRYDHDDRSPKE